MVSKIKRILLIFYLLIYSLVNVYPVYGTEVQSQSQSSEEEGDIDEEVPESSTVTEFQGSDEEAFKQSLVASQFTVPFGNTFYDVLSDPVIKETLTELYDNGRPKDLTYVKLKKKDAKGNYVDARVVDLLSTDENGDSIEFYVEYEYEELDPETNEMVTNTDYEKVFYTNSYTYFYLTLFLSYQPALLEEFEAVSSYTVDMDNYGNIVVNDKDANKRHRRMVVPNIINPMLNKNDEFYLSTLRFIYMYDTNMRVLSTYDSLTSEQMKKQYGGKLPSNKIGMYSIEGSESLNLMQILSRESKHVLSSIIRTPKAATSMGGIATPSEEYLNYINAGDGGPSKNDDFVLVAFGNSFEPGLYNRFHNDLSYGSLNEIMTTGLGKRNSSMAILPSDRLYIGDTSSDLTFEEDTISVTNKNGNAKGSYKFYYHEFESVLDGALNSSTAGQVGSITSKEVALASALLDGFYSTINVDKMVNIVYNATGKDVENGKPSDSIVLKPEDAYDQKVNNIVNNVDFFFNNIGTAFSSITSSNMSKQYFNLNTAFNENLLFNMTEVLNDPFVNNMLGQYVNVILAIALATYLLALIRYRGSSKGELLSYFKSTVLGVALCILPILVFSVYIRVCNYSTERILQDSYVNWFVGDINTDNSLSDKEIGIDKQLYGYFKEANSLPKKNKGVVSFYDSVPDENGSYLKATSLNELNRVGLIRGNGSDEDSIFANKDSYYKSIFFYFYDTFRWHMYNYYDGQVPGWENENGLVNSKGNFIKMITDPGFLYGTTYLEQEQKLIDGEISSINYRLLEPQDILGLTHLHTKDSVAGRYSYNSYVSGSYWYQTIYQKFDNGKSTARGKRVENDIDSEYYEDGIIHGSPYYGKSLGVKDFSNFELTLQNINNRVVKELQKLADYEDCWDETALYAASLVATFEYNKEINKNLDNGYKLYPTTFESSTYSMDTVYRSVFMRDLDQESLYDGDLMLAIESQGGIIVQGLTLICTFVGQVVGLEKLICSIIIFVLAVLVFVFAYNLYRNLFNKAWLGLLGLFLALSSVHALFLVGVNIICVPEYSVIRSSLFGSYLPGLKIFLLLVLLVVKGAAILFIAYFAFKYYKDLGGTIIAHRIEQFSGNISGLFTGTTDENNMESNDTTINTENSNMDTSESDVNIDGTVQFNAKLSDDDTIGVVAAENAVENMTTLPNVSIGSFDSDSSTFMPIIANIDLSNNTDNKTFNQKDSYSSVNVNDLSHTRVDRSMSSISTSTNDTNLSISESINSESRINSETSISDLTNTSSIDTDISNEHTDNSRHDDSLHKSSNSIKSNDTTTSNVNSKTNSNTYVNGESVSDSVVEVSTQDTTVAEKAATKSVESLTTYDALTELKDLMDNSATTLKKGNIFNQLYKERQRKGDNK